MSQAVREVGIREAVLNAQVIHKARKPNYLNRTVEVHSVYGAECNIFRVVYKPLQTNIEYQVKWMIQGRIKTCVHHWLIKTP